MASNLGGPRYPSGALLPFLFWGLLILKTKQGENGILISNGLLGDLGDFRCFRRRDCQGNLSQDRIAAMTSEASREQSQAVVVTVLWALVAWKLSQTTEQLHLPV